MKKSILILAFSSLVSISFAQEKYFTKTGKVSFDATANKSPEIIKGTNKSTTMVLDSKTGDMQFVLQTKGFEFERALMQEHFNENYIESTKFPKAEFKGAITNNATVNYTKDGTYNVTVKGKLTIHGVTNDATTDGKITVKAGKVTAEASFVALLADYKVAIPTVVADKVATSAKVNVVCALEALKK
ncbi:MAG: YceI family protein [Ferruginibacter sp.]|nr:YceI family protein [Ferruginibacter sp.]